MTKISNLYSLTNYIDVNSNGNVVIAAPTSGYALDVTGTGRFTGALTGTSITLSNSLNFTSIYGGNINGYDGTSLVPMNYSASQHQYYAGGTLKMMLLGNGNLLLGTTTDNGSKLQVTGAATFSSSVTATQVAIGTTSPATFLHVNGATAALPATSGTSQSAGNRIRLSTAAGTGILDIGCAGGTGMWLQSTDLTDLNLKYPILLNPNGGNVGIGTTNPLAKLTVSNAQSEGFEFAPAISSNVNRILSYNRGTSVYNGFVLDGETLYFKTYDAERMRITSSGNVGIGTTAPGMRLHVSSTAAEVMRLQGTSGAGSNNTQLRFYGSATAADLWAIGTEVSTGSSDRAFDFYDLVAGANRMRITSSGNVGIGTTTISTNSLIRELVIGQGITNGVSKLSFRSESNSLTSDISLSSYLGENIMAISTTSNIPMLFVTNSTERMRITSGGNVLIGTTANNGHRLQVAGTITQERNLGYSYSQTSSTGSTSIVDTFIDNNSFGQSSMYRVSFGGNPNQGGSGAYKANYVGYISVSTGWSGSNVTRYIRYTQTAAFDAPNIGGLTLSVFFFNGSTETTSLTDSSTAGYYIRLKITGYNTSFVGSEQYVYLTKLN